MEIDDPQGLCYASQSRPALRIYKTAQSDLAGIGSDFKIARGAQLLDFFGPADQPIIWLCRNRGSIALEQHRAHADLPKMVGAHVRNHALEPG
jgi:hypothetical protein